MSTPDNSVYFGRLVAAATAVPAAMRRARSCIWLGRPTEVFDPEFPIRGRVDEPGADLHHLAAAFDAAFHYHVRLHAPSDVAERPARLRKL